MVRVYWPIPLNSLNEYPPNIRTTSSSPPTLQHVIFPPIFFSLRLYDQSTRAPSIFCDIYTSYLSTQSHLTSHITLVLSLTSSCCLRLHVSIVTSPHLFQVLSRFCPLVSPFHPFLASQLTVSHHAHPHSYISSCLFQAVQTPPCTVLLTQLSRLFCSPHHFTLSRLSSPLPWPPTPLRTHTLAHPNPVLSFHS